MKLCLQLVSQVQQWVAQSLALQVAVKVVLLKLHMVCQLIAAMAQHQGHSRMLLKGTMSSMGNLPERPVLHAGLIQVKAVRPAMLVLMGRK